MKSTFYINGLEKGSLVQLYSVNGTMIFQKIAEQSAIKIDVGSFVRGMYLIRIQCDGFWCGQKVIIEGE